MKRVNIVGYYGMQNFGDDLFVATARANAERLWPGASVRTFTPARSDRYASMTRVGSALRMGAAVSASVWADTFAFCGGSVLQRFSGTTRLRTRIPGRRMEALGVSVGPYLAKIDQSDVGALLGRLDRLVVRDRASLDRAPNAVLGGDLAALAPAAWFTAPTSDRVVICPSAAAGQADAATFVAAATEAAGKVAGKVRQIHVLSLSTGPSLSDLALSAQIAANIRRAGQAEVHLADFATLGVAGTLALLSGARAVWSARLHAAVVAYLAGVPFLLAGHHEKCTEFGADIGLDPDRLLPADGSSMARVGADTLTGDPSVTMTPAEYRARAGRAYFKESA